MPVNWPPSPNPWPPPETGYFACSDLATFQSVLTEAGFTWRNPTTAENNQFFKGVKCDEGHNINGIIIYHPANPTRVYPFAYCVAASHRDLLTLWPPYYSGWGSA